MVTSRSRSVSASLVAPQLPHCLICLHGGPGFDHSLMKETFSPLADLAQVVLPDQRGNGRSDWSTADRWTLDTWIDDVPAFCEALEIERPVLLGGSFGGFVALGVAGRYPELPAKLVLLSTAVSSQSVLLRCSSAWVALRRDAAARRRAGRHVARRAQAQRCT